VQINYNQPGQRIPVYLLDASNNPVTGAVPTGDQLLASLSGAAWADGTGSWVEDANGLYYYAPTQPETATNSFLMLRIAVPGARVVVFPVDIGARVVQSTSDPTALRFPVYLVNAASVPQPSLSISGAAQQLSKNGAALVNALGSTNEIGGAGNGLGAYYYQSTMGENDTLGYDSLKIDMSPTALPYIYTWNVVAPPVPGGGGGAALIGSSLIRGGS